MRSVALIAICAALLLTGPVSADDDQLECPAAVLVDDHGAPEGPVWAEPVSEASTEGYCFAEAYCEPGETVSCEGSTVCTAHDAECMESAGYAECDGERTYCSSDTSSWTTCCPGDRFIPAGCCSSGRHRTRWEKCIDDEWVLYIIQCGQLGCNPF